MTDAGLASTIQHIKMLDSRRRRLHEAQQEAEEQLLHRMGMMHRAGHLPLTELAAIYQDFCSFKTPGLAARWNTHMDIPWNRMRGLNAHLLTAQKVHT